MKWLVLMLWVVTAQAGNTDEVRNPATVRAFKRANPCPANGKTYGACPGWIVDHKVPLCAGGTDTTSNMQYQKKDASLLKDKQEWALCRSMKKLDGAIDTCILSQLESLDLMVDVICK